MGKVTQVSDRRETEARPKRKRRKRDLDKIHSKILKAKKKLDNVRKEGNTNGQRKQGPRKICSRLLPKPAVGIYRNGAKGRNVQKAESLESTFERARLEADALKLFNGDTPESQRTGKSKIDDETLEQSPNSNFAKNSEWTPCAWEQSPVLGKEQGQNQKLCVIKKKGEENLFEKLDPTKTKKQNANNESKYTMQKEDICKRRLFQNDKEHLESTTITQIQEDRISGKKIQSQDHKDTSWTALNRYEELCAIISAENFGTDFLQNSPSDPVATTIKKLRHIYMDSFRQQIWREKVKRKSFLDRLENIGSSGISVEYQACSYSDQSQLSPVEFEVPKYNSENLNVNHFQEDISQKSDKFHTNLARSTEAKRSGDTARYSFTPSSSRNTFGSYSTNNSIAENRENDDKPYAKQSSSGYQPSKPISFCFVNERSSVPLDSQKSLNRVNRPSRNNIHIDMPNYMDTPCVDGVKDNGVSTYLRNFMLPERHSSKDHAREKLPMKACNISMLNAICDNCASNGTLEKCNDRKTNKYNAKSVKRVPIILRRCSNATINKINHHIQINDGYSEKLHRKSETNLFNESPIAEEPREIAVPISYKNLPTPSVVNISYDQSKMLESHIGSMKIKNSKEPSVRRCDINPPDVRRCNINTCSSELSGKDKSNCFDNFLHSCILDIPHDTNAYIKKLIQPPKPALNTRKHFLRSNNNRQIYCLQNANSPDFGIEPTKHFSRQTMSLNDLHRREAKNPKPELFSTNTRDQNLNILGVENAAVPTATLNCFQSIQTDEKSRVSTCKGMLEKADMACAKNRTGQNACHCDERYTYFDSVNCSHKCNISQACRFNKETVRIVTEPEISCNTECYNKPTNNGVDLHNGVGNAQLSLEQKYNPYIHSKVNGDQHRTVDTLVLQNVAQPMKYLAVKNGVHIQRIPVYINDRNAGVTEDVPLKVVALMDSNNRTKTFPQEVTTQIIPFRTNELEFGNFAIRQKNNPCSVRHLNSVNAVLFNPDLQSNTWYASNL